MKVTQQLKQWCFDNGFAGDASSVAELTDDACRVAAGKAVGEGKLSAEKLAELQSDEQTKTGSAVLESLRSMNEEMASLKSAVADMNSLGKQKPPMADDEEEEEKPKKEPVFTEEPVAAESQPDTGQRSAGLPKLEKSFSTLYDRLGANEEKSTYLDGVRVKCVTELFDGQKSAVRFPELKSGASGQAKHPMAGQIVKEGDRAIMDPSELEKAKIAAYFKFQMLTQTGGRGVPSKLRMTDLDKQLLDHALRHDKWAGVLGGSCSTEEGATAVNNRKLTDYERTKTIIDDTTSGGLEIAPIFFDDAVITVPLLFGELFPLVNLVPITRGRRIESATLGNVTLNSSGSVTDDTAISLFNTNGFISAFDTTIFVCDGAIEVGLDLMSDSPIDIGSHITQKYGEALLNWLDTQVALGDGTTEPEGIMNATGTTSVTFGGVAATIGGYEGLLFGVPKRYKKGSAANRIVFCSNETAYSRARGIPVGAADARRLFGQQEENYRILNHPYAIVDDMANTQAFFANMARYRMYRRLGLTMRMTTEGKDLTLRNKMLIAARARFGGQLEDGLAAAVATDLLA
jgi:HK97 family phage major capsid protein